MVSSWTAQTLQESCWVHNSFKNSTTNNQVLIGIRRRYLFYRLRKIISNIVYHYFKLSDYSTEEIKWFPRYLNTCNERYLWPIIIFLSVKFCTVCKRDRACFIKWIIFSDINECEHPGACGINAKCENIPGNYTCSCLEGFIGNPFDGVRNICILWSYICSVWEEKHFVNRTVIFRLNYKSCFWW
jgi:hypothetical protein